MGINLMTVLTDSNLSCGHLQQMINGAKTFTIMTLNIMTLCDVTISLRTTSIMTLIVMQHKESAKCSVECFNGTEHIVTTFSMMSLSIITIIIKMQNVWLSVAS
jgi:hypothetical protein